MIVDDDVAIGNSIRMLLRSEGMSADSCESGLIALELVKVKEYDTFLIDFRMPDMTGDVLTSRLRTLFPKAYIVGYSMQSKGDAFLAAGANAFIKLVVGLIPLLRTRFH